VGSSVTSSNSEIPSRAFAAALITTIALGLLIPTGADAFNRRSTLAVPSLAISPATDAASRSTGPFAAAKTTTALRLVGTTALNTFGLGTSNATESRRTDIVDHGDPPRLVELSGAWSMQDRQQGYAHPAYASLVPSYIPPELRLLPVLESLSIGAPSAMADFAVGYSLSALRRGPDVDEPVVTLQVLLGGSRHSELQYIRSRAKIAAAESADNWKPVVGGRFFVDVARKWTLALGGNARGFPTSGASDLSWNVVGSVGRNVGDLLEVRLGYRISRLDSREHEGTFGLSELVQGPQLGFVRRF
jgi:hypothetical protein